MLHRLTLLICSLLLFSSANAAASDQNKTATHHVEVIITVAGVQETVASINETSQQIAALTQRLSDKGDFSPEDYEVITALTQALNHNADAVNNIADALPKQFENAQGGINDILDNAKVNVQEVVSASKDELIDPTLSRIENRVLLLVLLIAAVLFGLLWYGLWQVRSVISTGSETIENVMKTVQSLEKVLEKATKPDNQNS